MKEDERSLKRIDITSRLPIGFDRLSEGEQEKVIKRLMDQDIELREELIRRSIKSEVAEHDLAVVIETVRRLDHERKIYSKHAKGETGSGSYDLKIKGGDTKFIIPILIVAGIIILGIIIILSL